MALFFFTLNTTTVAAQSKTDQFEVKVDGLGCPFCAYGLEKKFKEFDDIKDVKIEIETGLMTFTYPTSAMLTTTSVEDQVTAAGYTAVSVKVVRADGSVEESAALKPADYDESELIKVAFFVAGNCDMCKARIEKVARSIRGVSNANWDKSSKQLSVQFDQTKTSQAELESAVAKSGHDTLNAKTDTAVYDALPGCCKYDRDF